MSTQSIVIGTLSVVVALVAGNAAANANGSHHNGSFKMHFGNEHSFHHRPHIRFIARSNYDCSYYYDRWMDTGSRYWKHKYFDCRD